MSSSMYQASIPVFIRVLNNLSAILEKAAAHAHERKIEPTALLTARLYPDMFPLTRQVRLATDSVTGGAARMAGVEVPVFANEETSFPQLLERIGKAVAYLQTLKPAQIDGTEDKTVSWQTRSSTKSMRGSAFLANHVLPNLYFHVTTGYNILRHNGVALGKMDYLGRA